MTLLTLVRHGQTDWNLERRIQGTTDIPLNDTGRADARVAADRLSGTAHHRIYSSPLSRARETAEIIAEQLGLEPPTIVHDVREREFGEGEGMLVADYIEKYGDWHAEVPGAESLHEVGLRAMSALHRIAREARRRSAPIAESVIVVAHGGVIRALIDHVSGGTLPRHGEVLANGSVHRFEASPDSLRLLEESVLL
ncbi:histidine phosphatase family protein [Microbacterium sp. XT11]|uniref:histidine phosphatase family protein n=1 Tax=Microbacterium sp. XT11 TaxID=367477 RepID=UPI00082E6667|nr:histidine phosphatase family protein [Microbacterium sp. XT11]